MRREKRPPPESPRSVLVWPSFIPTSTTESLRLGIPTSPPRFEWPSEARGRKALSTWRRWSSDFPLSPDTVIVTYLLTLGIGFAFRWEKDFAEFSGSGISSGPGLFRARIGISGSGLSRYQGRRDQDWIVRDPEGLDRAGPGSYSVGIRVGAGGIRIDRIMTRTTIPPVQPSAQSAALGRLGRHSRWVGYCCYNPGTR